MAKEILAIPEQHLVDVCRVIRAGISTLALSAHPEVVAQLESWCDAKESYAMQSLGYEGRSIDIEVRHVPIDAYDSDFVVVSKLPGGNERVERVFNTEAVAKRFAELLARQAGLKQKGMQ